MKRFIAVVVSVLVSVSAALAASVHTLIVQPDDGRGAILDALSAATQSVDLTIYEINDSQINAALVAAQKRGAHVRVIYNYYSFIRMGRKLASEPALDEFKAAGIEVKEAAETYECTHQKTFTIDGRLSIVMTFNLQPNYFGKTRDFGVATTDPAEIAEIANVFEADWAYQPITPACASLVWSPVNSRAKILGVINGAKKTLEVYNEEAEDPECLAALIAAAKRGVQVRFITAVLEGKNGDGNANGRATLNAGGVAAKPGSFLYVHAKMVLADAGTDAAVVYLGSENFSKASLDKNRELGILLTEPAILGRLLDVFDEDWGKVQ